jgi:protein phosphatase
MQLIQMANDNGGRDNVSVILVKVTGDYPVARGWWARFLAWFK